LPSVTGNNLIKQRSRTKLHGSFSSVFCIFNLASIRNTRVLHYREPAADEQMTDDK
jgi:hypothetical protein